MNRIARAVRALTLLAGIASPGLVLAQIAFPPSPPMSSSGGGALPNVIVSVDLTQSMNFVDVTCTMGGSVSFTGPDGVKTDYKMGCTPGGETRLNALADALLVAFSDPSLAGKMRLAYQATAVDAGFGPNRFNPSAHDNSMRVFDAADQADFLKWADELRRNIFFCNPTQSEIIYAGEYLRGRWVSKNAKNFSCQKGDYPTSPFQAQRDAFRMYGTDLALRFESGIGVYPSSTTIRTDSPDPTSYFDFTPVPADSSPWNQNPYPYPPGASGPSKPSNSSAEDAKQLSCRRSYLIFMTDGGINGNNIYLSQMLGKPFGGTYDNFKDNVHTLPDGKTYDPRQYYGSLYSDKAPGNYSDFTLYYWATDLTGKGAGVVDPGGTMSVNSNETFKYGNFSVTYEPYWNPKNDPATWQHMQTYTVGFGNVGGGANLTAGLYNGPIPYYTGTPPPGGGFPKLSCQNIPIPFDGYDGSGAVIDYGNLFSLFATAALTGGTPNPSWPWITVFDGGGGVFNDINGNSIDSYPYCSSYGKEVNMDLLHAAYNGRGKFYPSTDTGVLTRAFKDIVQSAVTQSGPSGGLASATGSSSQVNSGTMAYEASYAYDSGKRGTYNASTGWGIGGTLNGWSGTLEAYPGDKLASDTPLWTAKIPAVRNIVTASAAQQGIAFQWSAGNLMGDSSGIVQADVTAVRNNPLGDIVDSQLVYVGKPSRLSLDSNYIKFINAVKARSGVVYVGANDGMLHGFDAGQGSPTASGSGQEIFAYVPRGLLGQLSAFRNADYTHRYWVDGSPFSGDAQLDASSYGSGTSGANNPGHWATVLAGALGAGGPGYFVL
ncbi:MAG: hypothetical protein LBQ32_06220, partial [Burkholderiaceae bacterium]|nr:hypothetical protein [Burkholderiaceae bacterium]